ncbi:MAG TPA: DNA topoisomerase IV subunit A, partial [Verrucomicrobia bacterium]|nr:DNA topoisomerase IV subunit A [Verrucomicrobiota bacterium]
MSGKSDKNGQPPSLFENMELFDLESHGDGEKTPREEEKSPADAAGTPLTVKEGLTGRGPLRDFYDENFRQYSAYVICSRAIPAVEDGLKPVQRRIMHSLWEKDDGRYTKVANIVGHAMQYHPHGDASIG